MPNVIREDIVQIKFDIEKSPLSDITKDLNKLHDKIKEVGGDQTKLKQLNKEFKNLNRQRLANLSKSVDDVTRKIGSGMVNAAKKAGKALATIGVAAGSAAVAGATLGVKYNAQMETYQTSFEVMTGSAEKAQQTVSALQKMGAATPFEMTDLAETTQLLMNYGFTADDAMSRMSMLGDISQGNADKMNRIAMAYGQMSSAGKVSLEDVKQMIEAGFNPLQEISQSTGESMASLYDRISDGKISVDEITASMKRSTSQGGKYFKSMEKQSKTFSGQLSTMQDNFNNMLGTLAKGLTDKLAGTIMPKINDVMGKLTDSFSDGIQIKDFINIAPSLGPLGSAIERVAIMIKGIVTRIKLFLSDSQKMAIVKDIFSTIGEIASKVGSIIGKIADEVWNFVTSTGFLETVKSIFEGISTAVTWVKDHLNGILELVKSVGIAFMIFGVAVKLISAVVAIIKVFKTIQAISTAAQLGFNAAMFACPITWIVVAIVALIAIIVLLVRNWDKVKEAAVKCWEWIKSIWSKAASWLNDNVIAPVKNFLTNFYYFVVGIFTIIKEWLISIWTPIANWVNANVIQPIVTFFTGLWNKISPIIQNVWDWICNIWGQISGWVDSNIIQPVANFFSGLWDNVSSGVKGVKEAITGAFQDAWDTVTGIWEGITSFFSNLWDGVKNIVSKIIGKGKEATGAANDAKGSGSGRKMANGGFSHGAERILWGEAGPEVIIPLSANKRDRGLSLWQQAGRMMGVTPAVAPQIGVAPIITPQVNLPRYTPGNTVSNSTSSSTENNNYSPQFTLNLSGTVDRTTERTVKKWIKEALQDTFDGMGRTNPRLTEV